VTAKIYHADIYGSRAHKYKTLLDSSLQDIDWQELSPNAPHYLFVPQEQLHREQYDAWPKITDVFPYNNTGIITSRDKFVLGFNKEEVLARVTDFKSLDLQTAKQKYGLDDVRERTLAESWATVRQMPDVAKYMQLELYRPFDWRHIFYHQALVRWPVHAAMSHMMYGHKNIALITTRVTKDQWDCLACNSLMGHKALAAYDVNYMFPLWLYPKEGTLEQHAERQPNLAPAFLQALQHAIGSSPTPEDVFHYAYATLHAPTYRTRYAPFLKTDFPRLPLPLEADAFQTLAALGSKLVALHLLEDPALAKHGIGFPIAGDHTVQKMKDAVRYTPPAQGGTKGRIKLNATEYFDNVPPEAWEFQVGGYRPASKWLADREGRRLTAPDIDHYRRTLAALRETAALLPQVDAAFTAAFPLPAAAQ